MATLRGLFKWRYPGLFLLNAMTSYGIAGDVVQFNSDVLSIEDRNNIDLSQFSRSGFIMPGTYSMTININKYNLPNQQLVSFYPPPDDPKGSLACLSKELIAKLGFKAEIIKNLVWWYNDNCLDIASVRGMEVRGDLGSSSLYLSVPQAFLEYKSDDWDPPSSWDEGIPGLLLDYNINAQIAHNQRDDVKNTHSLSGNGTVGGNVGVWRIRGDWQTQINRNSGKNKKLEWSRYYAYRALPELRAKLVVGEDYLDSDIFDSFRFTGMSLRSEDSMLPPNLRGYAPEIVGVARTNARVIISQQGRVLYETQVAAGPFRIQDIKDTVSGELSVRVEEQDGSIHESKLNTASIPYLTRPGMVRYKLAVGKPSNMSHNTQGPLFATGEFSWGINNGWSLYGGSILANDYNAFSLGVGRDLMLFGALSLDTTKSLSHLPNMGSVTGTAYRLSYSKRFDDYDSQITFAGYRYSQQNYMDMSEYLAARYSGGHVGLNKEMYTISISKLFRDLKVSSYLNYGHQTYWGRSSSERYSLSLSRYFDMGDFKNMSVSLTGFRNSYNDTHDEGIYLSLSIPWDNNATVNYNTTVNQRNNSHQVSYQKRLDEQNTYQLSTGFTNNGEQFSGYINHENDIANFTANASYQEGRYRSVGLSALGGMTLTAQGGALHRIGSSSSPRLLLDTGGVGGIPVRGFGSTTKSNTWGKVVVTDMNSYYRNQASIDLNKLGENAEATTSVVQATLTEGAIGYRQFSIITGEKAMAIIRLSDGSMPPFGASVLNSKGQEVGIVNDGGNVYLTGIHSGEKMQVYWNNSAQCEVVLPALEKFDNFLLPCKALSRGNEGGDDQVIENKQATERLRRNTTRRQRHRIE